MNARYYNGFKPLKDPKSVFSGKSTVLSIRIDFLTSRRIVGCFQLNQIPVGTTQSNDETD